MAADRPNRPNPPQKPTQNRPDPPIKATGESPPQKSSSKGSASDSESYGGRDGSPPSPWMGEKPDPDHSASFVEYLRWMRPYPKDDHYRNGTKVQILNMAVEKADYQKRLKVLTDRTKLIAGKDNWFLAESLWRIRVGGQKGPENILLPAFDALGMPYIPGSTLRGVARNQAIRGFLANDPNLDWDTAEKKVAPYFGALDAEECDRTGKVVFLDAYPEPSKTGGLAMDMANAIWSWEDETPKYSPNPNLFLSLEKATFVLGLRKGTTCTDEILAMVRQWLEVGLAEGIGSQVNTGYGRLMSERVKRSQGFFEIDFTIEGQLIHGHQRFTQWNFKNNKWQMRGFPNEEVRPTAFKAMLRYWFRALALGVLPSREVQEFETKLFGSISPPPPKLGWIAVEVINGDNIQKGARTKTDPKGKQAGTLVLSYSTEVPNKQRKIAAQLLKSLTWLMFHLGGIGQGARRPCYSRQNRENGYEPWWRGSTLSPKSTDSCWELPNDIENFQHIFRQRLACFHSTLLELLSKTDINSISHLAPSETDDHHWIEAIDSNCRIIVCTGQENFNKPYALSILHDKDFKVLNDKKELGYDGRLCGTTTPKPKPSPVWIRDLGGYQVVTIFGATHSPRSDYLEQLRSSAIDFRELWPLPSS